MTLYFIQEYEKQFFNLRTPNVISYDIIKIWESLFHSQTLINCKCFNSSKNRHYSTKFKHTLCILNTHCIYIDDEVSDIITMSNMSDKATQYIENKWKKYVEEDEKRIIARMVKKIESTKKAYERNRANLHRHQQQRIGNGKRYFSSRIPSEAISSHLQSSSSSTMDPRSVTALTSSSCASNKTSTNQSKQNPSNISTAPREYSEPVSLLTTSETVNVEITPSVTSENSSAQESTSATQSSSLL